MYLRKIIFTILLSLFIAPSLYSQDKRALAKSDSLFAKGVELYNAGKYSEAIPLFEESDKIDKAELDSMSNRCDYSSIWLASCYYKMGLEDKAKELDENYYMIEPVDRRLTIVSDSLSDIAVRYYQEGNCEEALSYALQCAEIEKSLVGENSAWYANTLSFISICYYSLENYAEAIRLGTEALEIMRKTLGKGHPDYAQSLTYLAGYNSCLSNYDEAVQLSIEALEIFEKIYGKGHPDYAKSLSNLALYNSYLSNYAEAIRLGYEATKIYEKVYGKEHSNYATLLNNLAGYNSCLGYYNEAIRLGTEALEVREKTLGKEHPDYAQSLNNLALYISNLGNYAEAIRLGTEALEINEKVYGKEHPDYTLLLGNLAGYNFGNGDYDVASNLIIASVYLYSKLILSTFSDLTTNERTLFWNKYKGWFKEDVPFFSFYIYKDSLVTTLYDCELLSKGLLLNSELEMNKLLQESGDSIILGKYEKLHSNRMMLNKLYEKPIAERFLNTDSLERAIQSQERELVQASKIYGNYTKNLSINWRQVQDKLGKNDVAIEFLNFGVKNDSVMYVALTLTKDDSVPHMIPLFEKKELDEIDSDDYYTSPNLSELVWKPLSNVMEDKKNIYFAPAGELHNIAIESIPLYSGEGIVSDKWKMYRLSSTRNLALIKDKNEIERADVYGGLKYTTDSLTIVKDSKKYPQRSSDFTVKAIADTLNRAGVEELSGAEEEAKEVNNTLLAKNIDTQLYSDSIGTEASFKALSGQHPNILHIATHGFYWDESEAKDMSYLDAMAIFNDDTRPRYVEDKALTRSGLFLTGVNHVLHGRKLPEGVDDGILTAKEISTLDFRGLDLVVLSACQTGLGEITGDGVFGLQRGFKKAGANTIVMSLWKVSDKATKLLMTKFYRNLLSEGSKKALSGETKRKAFREAQNSLRNSKDPKLSDPQAWAAFILLDAIG